MTYREYLKQATDLLSSSSISTARLDSLILMEYVLNIDRAKLLADPGSIISVSDEKLLNQYFAKRAKHLPIAYIVQRSEFYGRLFYIDDRVLEPRPETETMIELLKDLIEGSELATWHKQIVAADVGTGSGALGITASLECSNLTVDLIDIDKGALEVAKNNVVLHTTANRLICGDLLAENANMYDILLCNLPYVPDDFTINTAATHEPPIAIFGGKDGLDIYRKLFKLLTKRQHKPLYILTEGLPPSHNALAKIAKLANYSLEKQDDFIQLYKLSVDRH